MNMVPLSPVRLTRLAPELRQQVDSLIAGPTRYAGVPGSDDPGLLLAAPEPVFHPDAERAALQLRAARDHKADLATIIEWLEPLTIAVGNPPPSEARLRAYATVVAMACDFPLPVWEAAHIEALRSFKFWPAVEEVYGLLKRHDDRQLAEIDALERIAKGSKVARGPARASTEPYNPGVPEWALKRRAHPSMPKSDTDEELAEAGLKRESRAQAPIRTVEEQIAALGGAGDTDLLEHARDRLMAKREAKP